MLINLKANRNTYLGTRPSRSRIGTRGQIARMLIHLKANCNKNLNCAKDSHCLYSDLWQSNLIANVLTLPVSGRETSSFAMQTGHWGGDRNYSSENLKNKYQITNQQIKTNWALMRRSELIIHGCDRVQKSHQWDWYNWDDLRLMRFSKLCAVKLSFPTCTVHLPTCNCTRYSVQCTCLPASPIGGRIVGKHFQGAFSLLALTAPAGQTDFWSKLNIGKVRKVSTIDDPSNIGQVWDVSTIDDQSNQWQDKQQNLRKLHPHFHLSCSTFDEMKFKQIW